MEPTDATQSKFHDGAASFSSSEDEGSAREDEEVLLQWAAIQRLPTFKRLRTSLLPHENGDEEVEGSRIIDVTKLGATERHLFIQKLIKNVEADTLRLLQRFRERLDRVDVKLPTVEVKYRNLCVEAECRVVEGKPLPTLWNSIKSIFSVFTIKHQEAKISILKDANGIIKPSRLTLLLGPPGCGKTTLLSALAGKLDQSVTVSGEISYNGCKLEFPQNTAAYISQYDLHMPEMTVRETLDFSARCQGVGTRADILMEVIRREKEKGIVPSPEVDTYMKATSVKGQKRTLQTDYVLKILGLDVCADTMVGDAMRRGISGGQKRRLTAGEMIVGPPKAFFMDEISTGLDSSTTCQIVTYFQQLVHIKDATVLLSLLQPAPETFELFDDIILMAEGKIVYHGPRIDALKFFQDCGFKCPERKGVADFLQEVMSRKDQGQYWYRTDLPYSYISVDQFSEIFKGSDIGKDLHEELSKPYDKSNCWNAMSSSTYSLSKCELFKACMARELLLMKRNSFIHVFKIVQLVIIAFMTMTVFIRTEMAVDLQHSTFFMGSLFYTLIRLTTNGIAELTLTVTRLPVFYKQRAFHLYPAWAYAIPASILKLPVTMTEAFLWAAITYYVIGYSPEIGRFFSHFLLLFALHQASTSVCRFIAALSRTTTVSSAFALMLLVLFYLFGGFILPRSSLPSWLKWGFWISPMAYGEIGVSVNEFLAPRWQKVSVGNTTLGRYILSSYGLDFEAYFYWISLGALCLFMILADMGFLCALTYVKSPGTGCTMISSEKLRLHGRYEHNNKQHMDDELAFGESSLTGEARNGRLILPFEPLTLTFRDLQYYVDTPPEMRQHGFKQKQLRLLCDITGAFRPGILTALMGVSGAGKTTLMDVLSGRKTRGTIEGDIRVGGYPKVQKTFARISGYCEQIDIHSPQITVEESVIYSAWLRLPTQIDSETKYKFAEEVIQTIELDGIKDSLVGIPGRSGLSTEQRKRLTIAVELVSNPSIIFMDEPTSGLDARAAAIVMRAVKNVVATGRTTVCTIHQPSIDIFEAFDELIIMKRGGQIIYSGMLGRHSSKLIEYFEGIPGVPKIKDNFNPATWMLEVTSASAEVGLNLDFAEIYKNSPQYRNTAELVEQLSEPPIGSKDLHFQIRFPQTGWGQYKACLWKQHLSYWRNPGYNLVRLIFMVLLAIIVGVLFWQKGKSIENEKDLLSILGSMYIAVLFLGINNCSSVLPVVATERDVLYREKFAGMYSSKAYSLAQVTIELPYILVQTILFVAITYPSIGYYWSVSKVFWYFFATFCTFLYFVYLGMLIVSLSANLQVASILAVAVYTALNLFAGFLMPGPDIPKWWVWCYWINPTSWSLNGLLTSQYGDIYKEISIFGEPKAVASFLEDYFGFHHNRLWLVVLVLIAYPCIYAALFTYFMGKLNFQRR